MFNVLKVGDSLTISSENVVGVIREILPDDFGEPAALVVEAVDRKWYSVDLSALDEDSMTKLARA